MLEERKLRVLKAIIKSYITCAEPVGSRTISKQYDLGVSSATIRNEMSDLEDLGYLVQPHTSAGRIPSDKAYRLYVDTFLKSKNISTKKRNYIEKTLLQEVKEIEDIIQNSAKILSKVTNYTSLAIAPQINKSTLKHIQLIPIDNTKILVVIVTESGIVKNATFRLDNEIEYEQLDKISNLLTYRLRGHTLEQIEKELEYTIIKEMYDIRNTIKNIIGVVNQALENFENTTLYSDGVTNIFNFPEYKDISKAKNFLSFIEDKSSVIDMMIRNGFNDIEISIGNENIYEETKDCSLITATYSYNGKIIGKIGVIGPTRMNYSEVITTVQSMALDINDILAKYLLK